MENAPYSYQWFSKLGLPKFVPWHFDKKIDVDHIANKRFVIEVPGDRKVLTFGRRQDNDTCCAFEIVYNEPQENVIVFHPSFNTNVQGWNIIQKEYSTIFEFLKDRALPDMELWIPLDDVNDHIEE